MCTCYNFMPSRRTLSSSSVRTAAVCCQGCISARACFNCPTSRAELLGGTDYLGGKDGLAELVGRLWIERPRGALPLDSRNPASPGARRGSDVDHLVDLLRRYSNHSDVLEQLCKVSVILSQSTSTGEARPSRTSGGPGASRSRWLRDRFSAEELQTMIDLYCSGVPAREVAETYSVSLRSVKRLLQKQGVRRRTDQRSGHDTPGTG